MKHFLTVTLLTAASFMARADDKPTVDKAPDAGASLADKTKEIAHEAKDAIVDAARHADTAVRAAWSKTVAYWSEDVPAYRQGASVTLADMAKQTAELKAQTPETVPAYYRTRLKALDEQQEHLTKTLASLSPGDLKNRASGPRYEFDQCMGDLEKAIYQAQDGVTAFSKPKAK